jgi:hypothetical protein
MPPAATTWTGSPVKGLLYFLQMSTQAGMSATLSTLAADQVDAHRDGFLAVLRMSYVRRKISCEYSASGLLIMFITMMPALCSLSTTALGGTPTAQMNNFAFSSMMTSISAANDPPV